MSGSFGVDGATVGIGRKPGLLAGINNNDYLRLTDPTYNHFTDNMNIFFVKMIGNQPFPHWIHENTVNSGITRDRIHVTMGSVKDLTIGSVNP